jgi:hypothetical protein
MMMHNYLTVILQQYFFELLNSALYNIFLMIPNDLISIIFHYDHAEMVIL